MLKNKWQHVGNSVIVLKPFLCFLSSPSRRRNSRSGSYVSHYGINYLQLCNIVMNEINGVFVSVSTNHSGDCERAVRSPVFSLNDPVFNFVLHAMKKMAVLCP